MRRVVVDASAFAAMVFAEPRAHDVELALTDAQVFAPHLLKFELASVAWKKARQSPALAGGLLSALSRALDARWNLTWQDVHAVDAVLVAHATGLSVYDASYLWLAGSLGAELVTLDERLASASEALTA